MSRRQRNACSVLVSKVASGAQDELTRVALIRRRLLRWFCGAERSFFWRLPAVTPFEILVTEILLSRTKAEAVEPVARAVLRRFRTPQGLARANVYVVEEFLRPLGLQRKRARALVECSRALIEHFGGEVPHKQEDLLGLAYVGRYAASAVRCFAFHQRCAVMDANVARVYRRLFVGSPWAVLASVDDLWMFAERMMPIRRTREFNWALLDFGGTVCTPRWPRCAECPLKKTCDTSSLHSLR